MQYLPSEHAEWQGCQTLAYHSMTHNYLHQGTPKLNLGTQEDVNNQITW